MSEPALLVVAGCNGSGKSSYSRSLAPPDFLPFDYDLHFLKFYSSLRDSDIREAMAHNMAFHELEGQVNKAIDNRRNFCYETNFNSTPLFWPQRFKDKGYRLHLIYFCLDSIEEAKRRVNIRVQNGGHFVPESEIKQRYFDGFANLNTHFSYFDVVDVYDTSAYIEEPKFLLSIEDGAISHQHKLPGYLTSLIPAISENIQ